MKSGVSGIGEEFEITDIGFVLFDKKLFVFLGQYDKIQRVSFLFLTIVF